MSKQDLASRARTLRFDAARSSPFAGCRFSTWLTVCEWTGPSEWLGNLSTVEQSMFLLFVAEALENRQ